MRKDGMAVGAKDAADELGCDGRGCGSGAVVALVVMLVLATACFQLVPGDTLAGSLAQGALLAALTVAAVFLVDRPALALRGRRGMAGLGRWTTYLLVVGMAGGIVSLVLAPGGGSGGLTAASGAATMAPVLAPASDLADAVPELAARAVEVVVLCLLTGVFEEGVFRVLGMRAMASAFGEGRRGLLGAAVASSALFGLLHVSTADAAAAGSAVAWAQVALKPVQAGLFGFFMAALYVRTRSLWVLAGTHALFNLLYTGPTLMAGGIPATYATGDPVDLALLATSTLLLIPSALAAAKAIGR